MELKNIMVEEEMENYMLANEFDIKDNEGCIDSTEVIQQAIDMGYTSYMLNNEAEQYDEEYIFIK